MKRQTDNPIARSERIASTFDISALSSEMKKEIRFLIRKSYDRTQVSHYARHLILAGQWYVDGPPRSIWLRSLRSRMRPFILTTLCNKTTSIYRYDKLRPEREPDPAAFLASCFFDEWFAYHKGKPDIEFCQFFANLVPISPEGPKSIIDIIGVHLSTCNDALSSLEKIRNSRIKAPEQIYDDHEFQNNFRKFTMNPLYRAIFIIIDESGPAALEPDTTFDLSKYSRIQNALLIRTGEESDLSAPIDFRELRDQCLPLCRPDADMLEDRVIRVSLATAVKFISDLEHREYTAFPELRVGAGSGNLSFGSAKVAKQEMNYTTARVPIRLMEATEAVMSGTPYAEELSYDPYRARFRRARFFIEGKQEPRRLESISMIVWGSSKAD